MKRITVFVDGKVHREMDEWPIDDEEMINCTPTGCYFVHTGDWYTIKTSRRDQSDWVDPSQVPKELRALALLL